MYFGLKEDGYRYVIIALTVGSLLLNVVFLRRSYFKESEMMRVNESVTSYVETYCEPSLRIIREIRIMCLISILNGVT